MLCVDITTYPDGRCAIKVTDCNGAACAYFGYAKLSAHKLLAALLEYIENQEAVCNSETQTH